MHLFSQRCARSNILVPPETPSGIIDHCNSSVFSEIWQPGGDGSVAAAGSQVSAGAASAVEANGASSLQLQLQKQNKDLKLVVEELEDELEDARIDLVRAITAKDSTPGAFVF